MERNILKNKLSIGFKILSTAIAVAIFTTIVAVMYTAAFVLKFADDRIPYDVKATKLHLTSFIYVNDENGDPVEYDRIHGVENRVWVDFKDIPLAMREAVVAIEDKRFYKHNGVDLVRTLGAVKSLFSKNSNGGSTLTQQLIKNLTEDNEVSLLRKVREMFRARNFEKDHSKDEIIEAYLNIVYFGAGCRGVQSAAKIYFDKDVKDCSIAESAAIVGITQNPSKFNPFSHPDENKKRREIIIKEMYDQQKISKEQFDQAMQESADMKFVQKAGEETETSATRNWYMDMMLMDVVHDLCEQLGVGEDTAWEMIRTQGLQIYSAMDKDAQKACDDVISEGTILPTDKDFELGFMMIGFDGRVLANLGSRNPKEHDLDFDNSVDAVRQPGSSIKPIAVYAPAIDKGLYNYSSIIPGALLQNFYRDKPGPNGRQFPDMPLQKCVQWSSNVASARVLQTLTPQSAYAFMTEKLGFTTLDKNEDANTLVGFALGGLKNGTTVREMTAAFQIFGNGGVYNKPYTYFCVKDREGRILLDNRNKIGERAISSESATIMNQILRTVITGGTGTSANISDWELYGKTGTTDQNDSWFIGASPYAVAGAWTGYKNPRALPDYWFAQRAWKEIMSKYLGKKEKKTFSLDPKVIKCYYNPQTGIPEGTEEIPGYSVGYYDQKTLAKKVNLNSKPSVTAKEENLAEKLAEEMQHVIINNADQNVTEQSKTAGLKKRNCKPEKDDEKGSVYLRDKR